MSERWWAGDPGSIFPHGPCPTADAALELAVEEDPDLDTIGVGRECEGWPEGIASAVPLEGLRAAIVEEHFHLCGESDCGMAEELPADAWGRLDAMLRKSIAAWIRDERWALTAPLTDRREVKR